MKDTFLISFILLLMLWTIGVSYATYNTDYQCNRIFNKAKSSIVDDSFITNLLDNLDDDTCTKIQLAALVASGPEIGVSIFEAVAATRLLRQSKYADRAYIGKSADEIRLALAKKDLQGFDQAWEFVRTHPRGADAWEALITQPLWRTNRIFLEKVAEYRNAGLELIEDGGEILVKQGDGIVIGKLDPYDILFPDEMRVFGVFSKRHFDPHLAGGLIQYKSWENPIITQNGINDITTHLQRFGSNADNSRMINRLQKILQGEIPITDYDKRFYTHEIEEYTRYRNHGIPDGVNSGVYNGIDAEDFYYNAHAASLETFQIDEITSPLYHP